jgi:hypothetical protein
MILAGCGSGNTTASSGSKTTGTAGPPTLQSISISPSTAAIAQGTSQAFLATGHYSDGSTKDLTTTAQWSCLLNSIASVSNSPPTQGWATALIPTSSNIAYPVTALITATFGGISESAQLNISSATIASLTVSPATATLGYLNQQQYKATATFSDGTTQDVTSQPGVSWSVSSVSASPAPFYTSGSGLVIGNSLGTFNVSASFLSASSYSQSPQPTLTVDLSNLESVALVAANLADPTAPTIANNTQVQFSAVGTFNDGSTRDVTSLATGWSSDSAAVTNFGAQANVFSAASSQLPATANITATVGAFSPSTPLTVSGATLQSIALSPANITVAATTRVAFTAVGIFSDGSKQDLVSPQVRWSVQNGSGVAGLDGKGLLTGESAGSVTVTATSASTLGSIAGSTGATVSAATMQSVAVSPATAFMVPGSSLAYSALATFSDGSTQDVTTSAIWKSGSGSVATAASNIATGLGLGQSSITAKVNGITGTADLIVALPSQIKLAVTPATASVASGATTAFSATGTFVDGSTQDFTPLVNWSSSMPTVATVDYQSGVVSGLGSGSSTITATLGTVTAAGQVTAQ